MAETTTAIPGAALLAFPKTRGTGIGILVAAFITIGVRSWRRVTRYNKRKQSYQKTIKIYDHELETFQCAQRLHAAQVKQARSPDAVKDFQMKLILALLNATIPPDRFKSRAKRGWSEKKFVSKLKHYFPSKIFTGRGLTTEWDYAYTPDFTYWDSQTQLHIDIELDEPYAYRSRQPIHYIGDSHDHQRDQFFLEKGWLIVRFSEEQVVRWPESCCKELAAIIYTVTGDDSALSDLANVADLPSLSRWSKDDAQTMAETAYRQTYLTCEA